VTLKVPNGAQPALGVPRAGSPASVISTSDAENGSDDEHSNKRKLTNASAIASHLRPGSRGLGGRTWVYVAEAGCEVGRSPRRKSRRCEWQCPTGKPTKPVAASNKGNSSDSDDEDTSISRPRPHTVGALERPAERQRILLSERRADPPKPRLRAGRWGPRAAVVVKHWYETDAAKGVDISKLSKVPARCGALRPLSESMPLLMRV